MTAKEYLMQLQKMDMLISQKIQEGSDLRARLVGISSPDLSRDRVQGGSLPGEDTTAEKIAKLISLEEEIDRDIDSFVCLKHKIIGQIHGLSDARHIKLLYKRYVEFKGLETISTEMSYTYQYTRELHRHALRKFEKTYTNLHSNMIQYILKKSSWKRRFFSFPQEGRSRRWHKAKRRPPAFLGMFFRMVKF